MIGLGVLQFEKKFKTKQLTTVLLPFADQPYERSGPYSLKTLVRVKNDNEASKPQESNLVVSPNGKQMYNRLRIKTITHGITNISKFLL